MRGDFGVIVILANPDHAMQHTAHTCDKLTEAQAQEIVRDAGKYTRILRRLRKLLMPEC